jgi:hypothetical protein
MPAQLPGKGAAHCGAFADDVAAASWWSTNSSLQMPSMSPLAQARGVDIGFQRKVSTKQAASSSEDFLKV